MNYIQKGNAVALIGCEGFSIADTLECGQCFRYKKLAEQEYQIIAHGRILTVRQIKGAVYFNGTTLQEFERVWIPYFDLRRDYRFIKDTLSANDIVMRDAVEYAGGIHILRQDPWECLVSFIISQNNNIPRIKKITDTLAKTFGRPLKDGAYAFPTPKELAKVSLDDLLDCKTGFRAKYIMDAVKNVTSNDFDLNALNNMSTDEAREALIGLKGVGGKIADCVLLFAYGRFGVFPTDVWIKRVMQYFYFDRQNASITDIHKLAKTRFGEYAGFAQQYLYVYAREFLKNL